MGKEKGEENVIFYCLVGVKRERKENMVDGVFHLGQPFFSFQIGKKMGGELALRRKLQDYYPLFYLFRFYIVRA